MYQRIRFDQERAGQYEADLQRPFEVCEEGYAN
jgi:hypothetical protein